MGLITNEMNPWGDDEVKHYAASFVGDVDKVLVYSTLELDARNELFFVAKNSAAAKALIAKLRQAAMSLEFILEDEEEEREERPLLSEVGVEARLARIEKQVRKLKRRLG